MPASSSPTCSREPASIAWPRENYSRINVLLAMERRRPVPTFFAVVTGHETIETIHDITRKNFAATPTTSTPDQRSTNHVETDPPLLHRPSRRDLCSGLPVRPEHDAPRPARSGFDVRAPAGGRLQPRESCRGLRDLRRRRDQYPLITSFLPQEP